jgi:hypothetical protein
MVTDIVLIIVLLLASGFFSGIEIAYLSADRLRIELEKKKGSNIGSLIASYVEKPSIFLGTTLVGNNIVLVIFSVIAEKFMLNVLGLGTYIPEEDFKEYVTGLSEKKNLFLSIRYKSVNDFDAILKAIALKTPFGKLPDRKMIDMAFIDPKNFKPSFIDYVALSAKTTKDVAKTTVKVAAGVGGLLLAAKIIGAGIAAYLIVQSFGKKKGYLK